MAKGKVKGLSPKQFVERLRRKSPRSEDKFFGSKDWHRRATLDEQIVDYVISNYSSAEDFVIYFNENLKPTIEQKLKERREHRARMQAEFKEKKRIASLPENALVSAYLGKLAYPKHFEQITQKYSREDFVKVRNQILEGKLNSKLGSLKIEFQIWLNSIIDQKEPEPKSEETDNILRKTINIFRGH